VCALTRAHGCLPTRTRVSENASLRKIHLRIATLHPVQPAPTRTPSREIGSAYDNRASSAFIYNYFRDYDPGIGRFPQSDPIGLRGGLSTFGYVAQSPLLWIDPRGLDIIPGYPDGGGRMRPGLPVLEICIRASNPPNQPVPHGFLCVDGVCSGFYPRPDSNPLWPNPGEWRDDTPERSRSSCTPTPPPPKCEHFFASCIESCTRPGPRPYAYSLGGLTCIDRADSCLQSCRQACRLR